MDVVLEHNAQHPEKTDVDFLIKWNPRKQNKDEWLAFAEEHGDWEVPREGKRVALFRVEEEREWKGYTYTIQRVMRVVERTVDKKRQQLLIPEIEIEIEGWWIHSEFKTDMDIERLPSGKFATNALVLGCSMLSYNILRWIGQNGLLGPNSPKRNKAKRRRIKTVMQELIYVAVRMVRSARSFKLLFGKYSRSYEVFRQVFKKLAYD